MGRVEIEKCLNGCGDSKLVAILETAVKAATAAGGILQDLYDKPHKIKHKGAIDLVTEADVASEEAVIDILRKAHPEIDVLAEESRSTYETMSEGPLWIIDPLDGTTNFAHGFPWFGVSIAYAVAGTSKAGVIYLPMQDELFCTTLGGGAWLNGRRIYVSEAERLKEALVATGFPYAIHEKTPEVIAALEAVLPRAQGIRRAGSAALDLAYVACGRLDGFWEIMLKPWDTAAGLLLVEEAGGKVTDFRGGAYSPFIPEILASNGCIHEELTAILKKFGTVSQREE